MFTITEKATEMITEFFKTREGLTPVRIVVNEGT